MFFKRRYYLKAKKTKQFLSETAEKLNIDLNEFLKERFEVVELTFDHKIFLMNGNPCFVKAKGGEVFPTLINDYVLRRLSTLTVDMGAISHICNGADVMAPGVVKINGTFKTGDVVVVIDERFSKRIAIVLSLFDSLNISEKKHGKIASNIHYVNDKLWEVYKHM
jgi:PUA domain protein